MGGPHAEGDHGARAVVDEGQDCRTSGAQVLCLDRWLYPRFALDLPADVDLEAGVRRGRALDRAQEVLLKRARLLACLFTNLHGHDRRDAARRSPPHAFLSQTRDKVVVSPLPLSLLLLFQAMGPYCKCPERFT